MLHKPLSPNLLTVGLLVGLLVALVVGNSLILADYVMAKRAVKPAAGLSTSKP